MWKESVDVSITGNYHKPYTISSTPVAGNIQKKERIEAGRNTSPLLPAVATGRTLHPDNMAQVRLPTVWTDTNGTYALRRTVRRILIW